MKRRNVFLGYAVFYDGEPFSCSRESVARDKLYLRAHALFKLSRLGKFVLDARSQYTQHIDRVFKSDRKLTLRRVYAH